MTECIILVTVLSAVGWLRTCSVHIVVAASVTGSVPGGSLWLSSVSGRSFLESNLLVFIHLAIPCFCIMGENRNLTLHSRTQTLPFPWALSPFERTNVHSHSFLIQSHCSPLSDLSCLPHSAVREEDLYKKCYPCACLLVFHPSWQSNRYQYHGLRRNGCVLQVAQHVLRGADTEMGMDLWKVGPKKAWSWVFVLQG